MHIRPALESDIPALADLLSVLFAQEREFTPDREKQAHGLRKIVTDPDCGVVLVALDNARPLGMVSLLYSVSTALGERVAWLEDMVVAEQERGRGLGSRLLDEAVDRALAAGCRRITLLTDMDNQAAQRFYRAHRFERSTMVPMRRYL